MTQLIFINTIFIFLVSVLGAWIAFWVYFFDKKNKINQSFLLFTMAMISYLIFGYLSHLPSQSHIAILWKKLFFASIALFIIFTYFFSVYFPKKRKLFPFMDGIIVITEIIFFFLILFTDFLVKGIETWSWGTNVIWGPGKILWFTTMIVFTLVIVGQMLKKYFTLSFKQKLQTQYFLTGIVIFAVSNFVFNMFFPVFFDTYKYYYFGDYSTVFLLGFTAYAIVKKELFGIKVILTQIFIFLIALSLTIQISITSDFWWKMINIFTLVVFLFFGYLLARAVRKEEKSRRKAEKVAKEEKELRKKSEKLIKEFKRLNQAKNQFVMATQHHLRTPLTTMRGYLDLIFGGTYGKVPKKLKETLERFESSTVRLIRTINEFLDISQFQLGKEVVSLKPGAKIGPILEEMKEELSFQAEDKGIKLKVKKPKKPLPTIKADVEKLKAAFFNIADNAIKYTKKGSVTITAETLDSKIRVYIKDTGMGLSKEEQETLFSRLFERGEKAKKAFSTGRGIGLYLSYQIVKAHKGKLWAESDGPGKGSTFIFELPVEK